MSIENLITESIPLKSKETSETMGHAEHSKGVREIVKPDISYIEKTSVFTLFEQNSFWETNSIASVNGNETPENEHKGLTDEEKARVKEQHPDWPEELIDAIGSWEEYEIYHKANLKLEHINGKPCLVRSDIDMDQTDVKGRTNRQRMEDGLAPLDKNGKPIELHHIGQKSGAPLAELTFDEHHCGGNDKILHDKSKETEVHKEGNNWNSEREAHWATRSQTSKEEQNV